jgi:hypothetical protein
MSYWTYLEKLKQENRWDEAIRSLWGYVDATEEDSLFTGIGVVSRYYEELAIIFRRKREYMNEIKILTRYTRQRHVHRDSRREVLSQRLEKAKNLLMKATDQ